MKKSTKKKPAPVGRPRVGKPFAITVTDEQRAWLTSKTKPGVSAAAIIRDLIDEARAKEAAR